MDFAPQLALGTMLAGVPQYATYLLHRLYDRGMGLQSLKALAAYLISETASQDPKVGGPIKMAQITADAGYVELQRVPIQDWSERTWSRVSDCESSSSSEGPSR